MNWDDLRIFLAIARSGSMMEASRRLAVSHTTVSRRLTAFESELGVRLFEKQPGKLKPTEAGEELLERAERVEAEITGAELFLLGRDKEISGPLRLSVPQLTLNRWLMNHIFAFSQLYPDVELRLIATGNLLSLHRRETDVALRFTRQPPEGAVGRKLMTLKAAVYGSREYLQEHAPIEDYNTLDWIGLEPEEHDFDRTFLQKYLPHIRIKWRLSESALFYDAVLRGVGITRLPCIIADHDPRLQRIDAFPVEDAIDFWLLTHPALRHTARIRRFLDFLTERIREDEERHNQLLQDRPLSPEEARQEL